MRYLGIDHGLKRIGLALSDPEGRFAFPHSVVDGSDPAKAIQSIKDVIAKNDVGTLVIGLPLSFGGEKTPQAEEVQAFAAALSGEVQLPIEFENEILSSRVGERAGVPKEHLDASAAAVILQGYLDKQK